MMNRKRSEREWGEKEESKAGEKGFQELKRGQMNRKRKERTEDESKAGEKEGQGINRHERGRQEINRKGGRTKS